ncbi:MAG: hypothetical protein KG012_14180 [Deltaproteobacteria bacterium]|nr:hypothetical protein [Deltaproteobacteria bacterium]
MENLLLKSKGVAYRRITGDSLVSPSPCFLFSVELVANAVGAATAVLRDGSDANAEAVIDLAALTSSVDIRGYNPPLFFKRGLFVDVKSNVTAVLLRYLLSPGGG